MNSDLLSTKNQHHTIKENTINNNPPPSPQESTANSSSATRCTLCTRIFPNLQLCLRHELIDHNNTSNVKSTTRKRTVWDRPEPEHDLFNNQSDQLDVKIKSALRDCRKGEELHIILGYFCMEYAEVKARLNTILSCIEGALRRVGNYKICFFGSSVSGLTLKDSDVDVYIENISHKTNPHGNQYERSTKREFNIVCNAISRSNSINNVRPIRFARVPIIKCTHIATGTNLDINVSFPSSSRNTLLLRDYIKSDKRLFQLMMFLKIWAKRKSLLRQGVLSSYSFIVLILFYLQQPQMVDAKMMTFLPPIKELQKDVAPDIINGVNYAFDLKKVQKIPNTVDIKLLIQRFFEFYQSFDFEKLVACPYLGTTIPKDSFLTGSFTFEDYKKQLQDQFIETGKQQPGFQADHKGGCVQDLFCLNINIAKSFAEPHVKLFHTCVRYAVHLANDKSIVDDADLYWKLLFVKVDKTVLPSSSSAPPALGNCEGKSLGAALTFRITPRRKDKHSIEIKKLDKSLIAKFGSQAEIENYFYKQKAYKTIEALKEVIINIFKLNLDTNANLSKDKIPRMDEDKMKQIWKITGNLDLYSGRSQSISKHENYMAVQFAHTEELLQRRKNNVLFEQNLQAILTLEIQETYRYINLTVKAESGNINKKHPVRKFFSSLRNIMQNLNLQDQTPKL